MATLSSAEIAGMRATVLNTALDHVCTIQRRNQTGTDPDNQPIFEWQNHLVGIPCHYWEENEEELIEGENALLVKRRLVLEATRDISTDDRVSSITGYDGELITEPNGLDIEEVIEQVNQQVLALETVESND